MTKILIVEDEVSIAELEKDYLEISGYEVELSNDGDDGLVKALSNDYDLIILDIMLPGVDGFEILRRIRMEKDTPVILVSARKEDVDKIKGLGLGADDYITKPFSPSELVARVKAHLARYERLTGNGRDKSDIIEAHGLKIDKVSHEVFVDGKEVVLTGKEFDLLAFLAEHPNHVYTKQELFTQIWEMEAVGDNATVTVHIKKIREKTGDTSSQSRFIETIWGVGYRFK